MIYDDAYMALANWRVPITLHPMKKCASDSPHRKSDAKIIENYPGAWIPRIVHAADQFMLVTDRSQAMYLGNNTD